MTREEKAVHPSQESLPPRKKAEAFEAVSSLPDDKKPVMLMLLGQMEDGFWQKKRKEQFIALLERSRGTGIILKDIAAVLSVSNTSATRYKRQHDQHPENLLPSPGRPSQIGEVFDKIKNFIKNETENDHSVTLSVLMEYVTNDLHIETTKKVLLQFMKNHDFSYLTGLPTEDARVNLDKDKLEAFYTTTLPESLRGVHPSLVFNIDEMGAERYADRKQVKVFLPKSRNGSRKIAIGVPRKPHRCTLMACIALDGSTLKPAIITRNRTVSSVLFQRGYGHKNIALYHTKNSFVTCDVFERWLREIFIPYVEEKRAYLRQRLGAFDDRAVLLLDGCSSHVNPAFQRLLEEKNVTMSFLIPHSSHLSQPLDLGIFGHVKNLIRNEATYTINVKELAKDDVDGLERGTPRADEQEPRRTERGRALAESIAVILDAFERATSRRRVVSAFSQVGVFYELVDPNNLERMVTRVDPARARAVKEGMGLFVDRQRVPEAPARQIRLSNLNSDLQTTWSAQETRGEATQVWARKTSHTQTLSAPAPASTRCLEPPVPPTSEGRPATDTQTLPVPIPAGTRSSQPPQPPTSEGRPVANTVTHPPRSHRKARCPRHLPSRCGPRRRSGTRRASFNLRHPHTFPIDARQTTLSEPRSVSTFMFEALVAN